MRIYKIESETNDQTAKIINALNDMGIGYTIKPSVCFDAFIKITVDKKTWKKIKKELNLEIKRVYAGIR